MLCSATNPCAEDDCLWLQPSAIACEDRNDTSIWGTACAQSRPYCGKRGPNWANPDQTNARACPVTCGTCTSVTSPWQDVCGNLTAVPATLGKPGAGLFSANLHFSVDRLMAGTYDLRLRLPLKPNGRETASLYQDMTVILDVKGRVCANSSCVRLQGRGSAKVSAGTCRSTSSSAQYQQGNRLIVDVTSLHDISGLHIQSSHSVDLSQDMQLRFCTPGQASKDCELLLMSFTANGHADGPSFSAILPPLSHEGRHTLTVEHGTMVGCAWSTMVHAACKNGHVADGKTRRCALNVKSAPKTNPLT